MVQRVVVFFFSAEVGNDGTEHNHCIPPLKTDHKDGDKKWCGYQPKAVAVWRGNERHDVALMFGRWMTV